MLPSYPVTSPFTPPSAAELVALIRRLAEGKALTIHPRCQDDADDLDYDLEDIAALLACLDPSELHKHEMDNKGRSDYVAVLRIQPSGEPRPFYVKIAIRIPALKRGRILSFKTWT